jgi:hypothetical protein
MSDAELHDIEAGIDSLVVPCLVRADLRTLVAEVRRLQLALSVIARMDEHSQLASSILIARAALAPVEQESRA